MSLHSLARRAELLSRNSESHNIKLHVSVDQAREALMEMYRINSYTQDGIDMPIYDFLDDNTVMKLIPTIRIRGYELSLQNS